MNPMLSICNTGGGGGGTTHVTNLINCTAKAYKDIFLV